MRILPAILTLAGSVALAACASTGGETTYQAEYDRLNASCEARGGVLTPASSPTTGRPATDYVCDIRDGGRLASDRADRD